MSTFVRRRYQATVFDGTTSEAGGVQVEWGEQVVGELSGFVLSDWAVVKTTKVGDLYLANRNDPAQVAAVDDDLRKGGWQRLRTWIVGGDGKWESLLLPLQGLRYGIERFEKPGHWIVDGWNVVHEDGVWNAYPDSRLDQVVNSEPAFDAMRDWIAKTGKAAAMTADRS